MEIISSHFLPVGIPAVARLRSGLTSWSDDGSAIAFVSNLGICIMDLLTWPELPKDWEHVINFRQTMVQNPRERNPIFMPDSVELRQKLRQGLFLNATCILDSLTFVAGDATEDSLASSEAPSTHIFHRNVGDAPGETKVRDATKVTPREAPSASLVVNCISSTPLVHSQYVHIEWISRGVLVPTRRCLVAMTDDRRIHVLGPPKAESSLDAWPCLVDLTAFALATDSPLAEYEADLDAGKIRSLFLPTMKMTAKHNQLASEVISFESRLRFHSWSTFALQYSQTVGLFVVSVNLLGVVAIFHLTPETIQQPSVSYHDALAGSEVRPVPSAIVWLESFLFIGYANGSISVIRTNLTENETSPTDLRLSNIETLKLDHELPVTHLTAIDVRQHEDHTYQIRLANCASAMYVYILDLEISVDDKLVSQKLVGPIDYNPSLIVELIFDKSSGLLSVFREAGLPASFDMNSTDFSMQSRDVWPSKLAKDFRLDSIVVSPSMRLTLWIQEQATRTWFRNRHQIRLTLCADLGDNKSPTSVYRSLIDLTTDIYDDAKAAFAAYVRLHRADGISVEGGSAIKDAFIAHILPDVYKSRTQTSGRMTRLWLCHLALDVLPDLDFGLVTKNSAKPDVRVCYDELEAMANQLELALLLSRAEKGQTESQSSFVSRFGDNDSLGAEDYYDSLVCRLCDMKIQEMYYDRVCCSNGHVWPICSRSCVVIQDASLVKCQSCLTIARVVDKCDPSVALDCPFCGSFFTTTLV